MKKLIVLSLLGLMFMLTPEGASAASKAGSKCFAGDKRACLQAESEAYSARNHVKAQRFVYQACLLDDRRACFYAARYYASPRKGSPDFIKARWLFQKGCTLNESGSCLELGKIERDGKITPPNYKKAADYFQKSCALNNRRGCSHLISMIRGNQIPQAGRPTLKTLQAKICAGRKKSQCR